MRRMLNLRAEAAVSTQDAADAAVPLVVDLDGTLINTDLLAESAVRLLRRNPLYAFLFPVWLLFGRHVLKREIAKRVRIDPTLLPYNEEFLEYLRSEHAAGRQLVLATASSALLARGVFQLHGLFAELLCSDDRTNLAGARKRDALVARFGQGGFDYAGNGANDLAVWRHARKSIVVNPGRRVAARARALGNTDKVFARRAALPHALLRSLRLHQWVKNILVFAPLVAAHLWSDPAKVLSAVMMFFAFSLTASAVYQINDIADLDHDRAHARKRKRPIASGDLPIFNAIVAATCLLAGGLALGWLVSGGAFLLLIVYLAVTSAYSLALKAIAAIDVVVLACLYTIRILAGAEAVDVVASYWLLAFAMLLFLSLAILKRCAELAAKAASSADAQERPAGRGYRVQDLASLTSLGTALSAGAVVILTLYINEGIAARHYEHPALLWLLCPLMVFWMARMWLVTGRGQMHDDPIVFAARDRASQWTGLIALALIFGAA